MGPEKEVESGVGHRGGEAANTLGKHEAQGKGDGAVVGFVWGVLVAIGAVLALLRGSAMLRWLRQRPQWLRQQLNERFKPKLSRLPLSPPEEHTEQQGQRGGVQHRLRAAPELLKRQAEEEHEGEQDAAEEEEEELEVLEEEEGSVGSDHSSLR